MVRDWVRLCYVCLILIFLVIILFILYFFCIIVFVFRIICEVMVFKIIEDGLIIVDILCNFVEFLREVMYFVGDKY